MAKNKKTHLQTICQSVCKVYKPSKKPACSQLRILNPVSNFRRYIYIYISYIYQTFKTIPNRLLPMVNPWTVAIWPRLDHEKQLLNALEDVYLSIHLSIDLSIHPSIHTYIIIYIIIIVIVLILVTVVFPFMILYGMLLSVVLSRIIHDKSMTFSASHIILKINDSHLSIINIKC